MSIHVNSVLIQISGRRSVDIQNRLGVYIMYMYEDI